MLRFRNFTATEITHFISAGNSGVQKQKFKAITNSAGNSEVQKFKAIINKCILLAVNEH